MSVHMIYYNKDGAKMMRPVLKRENYMALRDSATQKALVRKVRNGEEKLKTSLIQMNYSCLPNEDGSLKGSSRMPIVCACPVRKKKLKALDTRKLLKQILRKSERAITTLVE